MGRIVILNGAPRSGKSSLARAMQDNVPGHWINLGVDAAMATLPGQLQPGIGLRPGGERPDLEHAVRTLYDALFSSLATHASLGFDIVADLGLHEDYSRPLGILPLLVERLSGCAAYLVGIDCDLAEIMRRRNADPRNGLYLGGDTAPPPVLRWQEEVHRGKDYDLRLDMGRLTPETGAARLAEFLARPPSPPVLARLCN